MNFLQLIKASTSNRLILYLCLLVGLCIMNECLVYAFIFLNAGIFQILMSNPEYPPSSTFFNFILVVLTSSVNSWLIKVLCYNVAVTTRENMTRICLQQLDKNDKSAALCENADQRVCDECNVLAEYLANSFVPQVIAPFLVAFYFYKSWLYSELWYFPVAVMLFYVLMAAIGRLIISESSVRRNISSLCEGDLRSNFVNYLSYHNQAKIANHRRIHLKLLHTLLSLATNAYLNYKNVLSILEGVINLTNYLAALIPYLLLYVATQLGVFKTLSQNELVQRFQVTISMGMYLTSSCSRIINLGDDCVITVNSIRRIRGFLSSISQDENVHERVSEPTSEALMLCPEQALSTDDGSRILLEKVTISLEKGQSVLLVGKSGTGKSTIFQQIARSYRGQAGVTTLKIRWKREVRACFLSCDSRPLPHLAVAKSAFFASYLNTLHPNLVFRERIWFYLTVHGLMLAQIQDNAFDRWDPLTEKFKANLHDLLRIFDILRLLNLIQCESEQADRFCQRLKHHYPEIVFDEIPSLSKANFRLPVLCRRRIDTCQDEYASILENLSSGERQRLLFVSLLGLKQAPDLIFIDEATNHIDSETERFLLLTLVERGSTLFHISQSNYNKDLFPVSIRL